MRTYFVALFLLPFFGWPQPGLLAPEAQTEDLKLLYRAIQEAHPAKYHYTPKPELDSLFAEALRAAQTPHDELGFFRIVAPFVAAIRCEHTQAELSRKHTRLYRSDSKRFPETVVLLDDRLFFAPGEAAFASAEILAINGQPVPELLETLYRGIPSDGYNRSPKRYLLQENFQGWYYRLVGAPDSFVVQYRKQPAPDTLRVEFAAQTYGQLFPDTTLNIYSEYSPVYAFQPARRKGTAILTLRTFDYESMPEGEAGYQAFLEATFRALRKAGTGDLLLDLRGNTGGNASAVTELLGYLLPKRFQAIERYEVVSNRAFTFLAHSDQASAFPAGVEDRIYADLDGNFYITNHELLDSAEIVPRRQQFQGRLWVLTDGATASAAALTAALLRSAGRATFLGSETSGCYYGCTGGFSGNFHVVTLPNSQVQVVIPTVKFTYAVQPTEPAGRGTIPDIPLAPQHMAEFQQGPAFILEKALAAIELARETR